MNAGFVVGAGLVVAPVFVTIFYVFLSNTFPKMSRFEAVLIGVVTWAFVVLGLGLMAGYASKCGGSGSHGRYRWHGNACVDTRSR